MTRKRRRATTRRAATRADKATSPSATAKPAAPDQTSRPPINYTKTSVDFWGLFLSSGDPFAGALEALATTTRLGRFAVDIPGDLRALRRRARGEHPRRDRREPGPAADGRRAGEPGQLGGGNRHKRACGDSAPGKLPGLHRYRPRASACGQVLRRKRPSRRSTRRRNRRWWKPRRNDTVAIDRLADAAAGCRQSGTQRHVWQMVQESALGPIIERIHGAALDPTQWSGAVAAIAEVCGAHSGILYERDQVRHTSTMVGALRDRSGVDSRPTSSTTTRSIPGIALRRIPRLDKVQLYAPARAG